MRDSTATLLDAIRAAAHELWAAGYTEATVEHLAVYLWRADPQRFGLRGYEQLYPDMHRVSALLYDKKTPAAKLDLFPSLRPRWVRILPPEEMERRLRPPEPAPAPNIDRPEPGPDWDWSASPGTQIAEARERIALRINGKPLAREEIKSIVPASLIDRALACGWFAQSGGGWTLTARGSEALRELSDCRPRS